MPVSVPPIAPAPEPAARTEFEAASVGSPRSVDEREESDIEARPLRPPALPPMPRRDLVVWRQQQIVSAVAIGVAASLATTAVLWLITRSSRRSASD